MNFKKENNLSKTWEVTCHNRIFERHKINKIFFTKAIQKFEDAPPQSLEETISNVRRAFCILFMCRLFHPVSLCIDD